LEFEAKQAYCPCEKCCGAWAKKRANGVSVYTGPSGGEVAEEANHEIAADWSVLAKEPVV